MSQCTSSTPQPASNPMPIDHRVLHTTIMSSECAAPGRRCFSGRPLPTPMLAAQQSGPGHHRRGAEFASHLHWRASCAITAAGCAISSLSVGCRQRQTGSPRTFCQYTGKPVFRYTRKLFYQFAGIPAFFPLPTPLRLRSAPTGRVTFPFRRKAGFPVSQLTILPVYWYTSFSRWYCATGPCHLTFDV